MSLNSTHIYLTWEPPPPSQVNGVIREYRVNVTEDVTGRVFQYTTTPNDRQLTVGSLHPYYIYHCSVVALTVQLGPYTSVFTIQTAEDGETLWSSSMCRHLIIERRPHWYKANREKDND